VVEAVAAAVSTEAERAGIARTDAAGDIDARATVVRARTA
jgi:hypothetical protein